LVLIRVGRVVLSMMRNYLPVIGKRIKVLSVLFTLTLSLGLFASDGRIGISNKQATTKTEVIVSRQLVRRFALYASRRNKFRYHTQSIGIILKLRVYASALRTLIRQKLKEFICITNRSRCPFLYFRLQTNPELPSFIRG
jgi:hypothetical protein